MVARSTLPRRRFTADEYHRMVKAGILREDDRVELIEVSDTTFAYDRGIKLRPYATVAIPELSIWDLKRRRVLIFRDPADGAFIVAIGERRVERIEVRLDLGVGAGGTRLSSLRVFRHGAPHVRARSARKRGISLLERFSARARSPVAATL